MGYEKLCTPNTTSTQKHNSENIADVLKQAITEWNLGNNPSLVTDSAPNIVKAGVIIGADPLIGCFAHTINLAAQKSLKIHRISQVRARVRRTVLFFHRSTTAASLLKAKANLLGLPDHKLIQEVDTRWNSTQDMLSRFVEMQCAVFAALRSGELSGKEADVTTLFHDDNALAEACTRCLQPLKTITTLLCMEKTPTISIIMPLHFQLLTMMSTTEGDTATIKEMKSIINTDLKSRYKDSRQLLLRYTAIDPRLKSLAFLSEADRNQTYDYLAQSVHDIAQSVQVKEEIHTPASEESTAPPLPTIGGFESPPKRVKTEVESPQATESPKITATHEPTSLSLLLGDVFVTKVEPPKSLQQRVKDELTKYLNAPADLDANPLEWWRENSIKMPLFARYAKSVLCIPATSVPSERVFSTAGDIVTSQRSQLSSDRVDMLIFLKKNM